MQIFVYFCILSFVQNLLCGYYNLQPSLIKCRGKIFNFTETLEINKIFSIGSENTENIQKSYIMSA
jgi:hypothetical protein